MTSKNASSPRPTATRRTGSPSAPSVPTASPSFPATAATITCRRIANYRANVAVMRELGVRLLLAPFAAGSLQPTIHPGDFVVVDQLVDRTSGRADTFFDSFEDGPHHVSLADPYDAHARGVLV